MSFLCHEYDTLITHAYGRLLILAESYTTLHPSLIKVDAAQEAHSRKSIQHTSEGMGARFVPFDNIIDRGVEVLHQVFYDYHTEKTFTADSSTATRLLPIITPKKRAEMTLYEFEVHISMDILQNMVGISG
ncbi:hypothetical protein BC941DRAFT_465450 [Chlamydoabsidia padenii]|nr:hypothetical protein BC941DRAFT_465450 [Chlamydoabsidia padenii]